MIPNFISNTKNYFKKFEFKGLFPVYIFLSFSFPILLEMEAIYGEMEVESCYTLLELPSPKKKRKSKSSMENSDKPKKPR